MTRWGSRTAHSGHGSTVKSRHGHLYRAGGKRCLDLIVAIPLVILLTPVFLVIAGIVRWRLGGPVLFRQERPGAGGLPFTLVKFRTMTDERGSSGELLPDISRITGLGTFLRSSSLDELPELLNVIRGHMSLVGPRPLLIRYLDRYTTEQSRRHDIRPGVTGWAQVNGRNQADWADRLAMDVWYVDNVSLALDLRILWRTAVSVLRRDGIAAEGEFSSPEFLGTLEPLPGQLSGVAGDPSDKR